MNPQFACLVTGTDTGVGKTLISAALLHRLAQRGLRVVGMKPVAAGTVIVDDRRVNEDTEMLRAASNVTVSRTLMTPYLFDEPAAPHLAAQLVGVSIAAAPILAAYHQLTEQAEVVIVEGVGGFMVPLADGFNTADMALQLQLPIVMVVGIRLGCLNHALLTAEAIDARGLTLVGWVANLLEDAMPHANANIATLARALQAPLLGVVPRLPTASAAFAAVHLDIALLSNIARS